MPRCWRMPAVFGLVIFGCFAGFGKDQLRAEQLDHAASPLPPTACGRESSAKSPDGLHSAYISCEAEDQARQTLALTVIDAGGNVIADLSARLKPSCTPGPLEWLDNNRLGVICQTDRQVRNYIVFDLRSKMPSEYPGYWFKWSPDQKTLADVKLDVLFGTPAGENSCLLLSGQAVYPPGCDHAKESYNHIHTFLLPPVWSPDSGKVAFVEKIFDWEYTDPFIRYFDGRESNVHYYLVIASAGHAAGYPISAIAAQQTLEWQGSSRLMLGDMMYDMDTHPPGPVP